MKFQTLYILGLSVISLAANHLSVVAQTRQPTNVAQKLVSWQQVSKIALERNLEELNTLIPKELPKNFTNGQVAITSINWYHFSYVVAKEGIKLGNLTSVGEQTKKHSIQFNAATSDYSNLPSLEVFPTALYKSGKLIEVSKWAAGRDSDSLRKQARESRQARLSDGRKAYYLKFSDGKEQWCAFENESEVISDYTCVSYRNYSTTALRLLESIETNSISRK